MKTIKDLKAVLEAMDDNAPLLIQKVSRKRKSGKGGIVYFEMHPTLRYVFYSAVNKNSIIDGPPIIL